MNLKKATIKDAETIENIAKQHSFEEGRNYSEIISSEKKGVFVIEEANQIIAFLGYGFNDWNSTAGVINIFVLPDFRQKGVGSKLVQHLIKFTKETNYRTILAEAPSKGPAPALYRKNGFRKCGFNDRYYDNNSNEIAEFYSFDLK